MKINKTFYLLFICINVWAFNSIAQTADSLGLPGDDLDLYGVLDLFKKSDNPEDFEKKLNSSETKLNNLDLNGDGKTDYIRVIDKNEGEKHALILQIPVNEDEAQDVAVIEILKNTDETAHLQIIGDEELYGKNYIIEPSDQLNTGKTQSAQTITEQTTPPQTVTSQNVTPSSPQTTTVVNVMTWPVVRYIYVPTYVPWVSPWRWRYYPPYWRPWQPIVWINYYNHWHPYRYHYRRWNTYRYVDVHNMYYGQRVVSKTVYERRTSPTLQPQRQNVSPAKQPRVNRGEQQQRNQKQYNNTNRPDRRVNNPPARNTQPSGGGRQTQTGPRR